MLSMRRRHSWILRDAIHVRSETGKKKSMKMMLRLFACKCIGIKLTNPVISTPIHEDEGSTDLMEMLPFISCVMSHFERELHFENLE